MDRPTRRPLTIARRAAISVAVLVAALAPAAPAAAATGCSATSSHAGYATYNCYMYKTSTHGWNMWQDATALRIIDDIDAILYKGTSWFVCQRTFGVTFDNGSAVNNYWAYTLTDNGYWGWINVVYLSGGANYGPVPGLPGCGSGFGSSGSWPHDGFAYGKVDTSPNDAAKIIISAAKVIWG